LAGLIVFALSWRKIALYLKARRERDLLALRSYHNRLSLVVGELLSRANELDQQSKYLPAETEREWSRLYEKLGQALVLMGDTLAIIKDHVDQKNVKGGREVTLLLCREATWVSRRLLDFETRLLTVEQLQVEEIKAVQQTVGQSLAEPPQDAISPEKGSGDTLDRSTTSDGGNVE
jgi:hypothetical protein